MEKQFLNLISCFTKDDNLTGDINIQSSDFSEIVNRFNSALRLKNETLLVSEYMGQMIAPVPFASGGKEIKFVTLGLNPHLDTKYTNKTVKEKQAALSTWEEYSRFYNSEGIFKHVAVPIGRFYREMTPLATSLIEGEYINWLEFKQGLTKEETSAKVIKSLENFCAAEFIPFHSHKFKPHSSDVEKLFNTIPEFKNYLTLLFDTIHKSLSKDGWIVCNGSNSCDILLEMVSRNQQLGSLELVKDYKADKAYSLYYWGNRRVVLLHHFYAAAGRGLKLSSNEDKKRMIKDVIQTFKG